MLPGDDVFDVMRERTQLLPRQTVFTAITRYLTNSRVAELATLSRSTSASAVP